MSLRNLGLGLLMVATGPLASCGTTVVPQIEPPAAGFTPATRPQPTGVIGADARGLIRLFGAPRLDIRDPGVRKLQFGNSQCILDAYLYPPAAEREPLVAHAEARNAVNGADMDWNACARLLRGD